jgi:hypothetical protein
MYTGTRAWRGFCVIFLRSMEISEIAPFPTVPSAPLLPPAPPQARQLEMWGLLSWAPCWRKTFVGFSAIQIALPCPHLPVPKHSKPHRWCQGGRGRTEARGAEHRCARVRGQPQDTPPWLLLTSSENPETSPPLPSTDDLGLWGQCWGFHMLGTRDWTHLSSRHRGLKRKGKPQGQGNATPTATEPPGPGTLSPLKASYPGSPCTINLRKACCQT